MVVNKKKVCGRCDLCRYLLRKRGGTMRIIAGAFRGRALKSPKGLVCRPAMARTRAALFSMLEARGVSWGETKVLDVFAGSGSLSFEALSRGAVLAVLLEKEPALVRCISENASLLGVSDRVQVLGDCAIQRLKRPALAAFQVVFVDPPYRKSYAEQALRLLTNGWLCPGSLIACEVEWDLSLAVPPPFSLETERRFGQTKVCLLRLSSSL